MNQEFRFHVDMETERLMRDKGLDACEARRRASVAFGGGFSAENVGLLLAYSSLMFGVCLLACVVPTLRALRVEPTQAMRTE